MCFIKWIEYFSEEDNTEEFLTFIRNEKHRSGVMTSARPQPFCRKKNINIGYFNDLERTPRTNTQRKVAFNIHNFHFCLFRKSNGISFNQAKEDELKPIFEVFDNVISDKYVKSFIK